MTTEHGYILEVSLGGLDVEARFNDVPMYRSFKAKRRTAQIKLNAVLVEGTNVLDVRLGYAAENPGKEGPEADIFLYKMKHGERTTADDVLVQYRWLAVTSPLPEKGLEHVFEHKLEVRRHAGRFAWEYSPPYMPEDLGDVTTALRALHDAFARKDTAAILAMMTIKTEEVSRSVELDPVERAEQLRNILEGNFRASDYRLAPFPPELVAETSARGRMVELKRKDGAPVIVGRGADMDFVFPVTYARTSNRWQVVR